MVNRRVKQVISIVIAVAFVASIFFFIPSTGNNTPMTYYIIVPRTLINSDSPLYSGSQITLGNVNYSVIGSFISQPISTLITFSNSSDMLGLTEAMLKSQNVSFNVSGGYINCVSSPQFLRPLCFNINNRGPSQQTFWVLLALSNGKTSPVYTPLSSVNLRSLYGQNVTYLLEYFVPANQSSSSSSTSVPLPP